MSYKKFILLSLLLPLPIILALVILLFVYDPLQIFHKAWFRENTYHQSKMRQNNLGIIRDYDFNNVIIGTSMLMNTTNEDANKILGKEWMNLSMHNSSFKEKYTILSYLLKNKKINNIIYSLDDTYFGSNPDISSFDFLYDNNIFNDITAYFNFRFLSCALTYSMSSKCIGTKNIKNATLWIDLDGAKDKFGGFNKWIDKKNSIDFKVIKKIKHFKKYDSIEKIDSNKNEKYLQNYLFSLIKQNKNINFYIIIPTYTRLKYKLYGNFNDYKKMIYYVVNESKKYPNIKIYGFDDLDYADNIANYNDLIHYNTNMNLMQLNAIKNNTNRLTPQNIDKYFQIMEEKIKVYDIKPLQEQIKKANLL